MESNDLNKSFLRPLGPGDPKALFLSSAKALAFFSINKCQFVCFCISQWGELALRDFYPTKVMANHKNVQTTIFCRPTVFHTSQDWLDLGVPCLCWLLDIGTVQQILNLGNHFSLVVVDSWQVRNHVSLLSEIQWSIIPTNLTF